MSAGVPVGVNQANGPKRFASRSSPRQFDKGSGPFSLTKRNFGGIRACNPSIYQSNLDMRGGTADGFGRCENGIPSQPCRMPSFIDGENSDNRKGNRFALPSPMETTTIGRATASDNGIVQSALLYDQSSGLQSREMYKQTVTSVPRGEHVE